MRRVQCSSAERSGRRRTFFLHTAKQHSTNNEFDPRTLAMDREAQPGRDFPGNQVVGHGGVTKWFLYGGWWRRLSEAGARDY